jgi:hypothetical protein
MNMYRVVLTDNFNRESTAESFAISFSMSKEAADEFAALFNKWFGSAYSQDYWKVVPADYKLFKPDY